MHNAAKRESPKSDKSSWRRLTAGCLLSLHTSAAILPAAVLLLLNPENALAAVSNQDRRNSSNSQNSQNAFAQRAGWHIAQVQIPIVPFELQNTPPQRFQQNPQFRIYRLGTGDSIGVVVPRFPELNGTFAIDTEGNALLPLVGKLRIAGFTLDEAQERIRAAYNRFVVNPQVTVALAGARPVQITLTGEVVRPGFYGAGLGGVRLSAVLLTAGGTTTQADLRAVLVRRFLSDGSYIEQKVDFFTPLLAGDPLPDVTLQDGDAVIVPKLEVGNLATYDRQLVARSTLAQPTIVIRVLSYDRSTIANLSLRNGSNFLDAITAIAPSLETADIGNIGLIRFDPERGRAIIRELNTQKALFGDASQNVPLRENDVIVIGRNLLTRIGFALRTIRQPFDNILNFLIFLRSFGQGTQNIFLGPGSGTGTQQQ